MDKQESKIEAFLKLQEDEEIHIPPEIDAILDVIDQQLNAGKTLENLFVYNEERKTWKLKRRYQLSAIALEQRRAAASKPRPKKIPDDFYHAELMKTALEMRDKSNKLIEVVRDLNKRGNGKCGDIRYLLPKVNGRKPGREDE